MNINKSGAGIASFNRNDSALRPENLENLKKLQQTKANKNPETVDRQSISANNTTLQGMQRLSPIDQYRYIDGQTIEGQPTQLRVVPGNPQKTLEMANKVINDAVMPPVFSNPNRSRLTEAMQIKHLAESMIDKAA